MFLAFGTNSQNNANYILQSTNGTSWALLYTSSNALFAAVYGNNKWVFIGTNDIVTATVTTSNWNWSEFEPDFSPACITFGNGVFVMGAYLENFNSIFSSSDGISWDFDSEFPGEQSLNFSGYQFPLTGIAYGNGIFVATVFEGNPKEGTANLFICTSTNFPLWSPYQFYGASEPDTNNAPVAFGGNEFIYCFDNNTYTSTNGYTWNAVSNAVNKLLFPFSVYVDAFTYGQGTFVAASYPSYISGTEQGAPIYQSGVFANPSNSTPTTLSILTYPGVTINGTVGAVYRIQYTTNLNSSWQTLTNFVLPFSPYIWVDTSSPAIGQRFYRSIQLQ
jgi:hypothetical protein